MGGPRNHKEGRINHPPRPGGPNWSIRLFIIEKTRPDRDKFGYIQTEVASNYAHIYRHDGRDIHWDDSKWAANCIKAASIPDTKCGLWFSQNGCHSTIIIDDKMYVLMGVQPTTKARVLKLKEASFTQEVIEWVDQCVSKAIGGHE